MIGNSNVVKYAMQLADDAVDLSGQIAGVNGHGELPRQLLEASIRSVQNERPERQLQWQRAAKSSRKMSEFGGERRSCVREAVFSPDDNLGPSGA
jgi:sRNA-binding protein